MTQLRDVAEEHARFRRRLAVAAAAEAATLWRQVDPGRIAGSWTSAIVRLLAVLSGAQQAVAGRADSYLDDVLDAQGVNAAAEGRVAFQSLAGVASDGRPLATLLYRPAVSTLLGISRGASVSQALAGGADVLDMVVRTQVADAGRAADQVALVARPQATGYVRMLVGASCSRCAILAGRRYSWNATFNRHPRCDCTAVPAREDSADDLRTDPRRFFDSLSASEQDRVFTRAGAEAIRLGADLSQVVNARRGMASVGESRTRVDAAGQVVNESIRRQATTRIAGRDVFTTVEAAGRRPRLMPEHIVRVAGGDRAEAIRLLRLHRYLQ